MKKLSVLNQRGSILLVFIIVLPPLILMTMYYMSLSLTSSQVARFDQLRTEAQLAADAGADYAVGQFSQNNSWTGTTGEMLLHSDSSLRTTYTASISGNSTTKTVAITGRAYWPASATTPRRTVSIYVDLRPVPNGNYSVVAGAGGLFMSNSSKIVGGEVFLNGELNMSNTAQIGLSTAPVNIKVANQRCPQPPDATYPRLCNAGEYNNPITMNGNAKTYGTVMANNQTNANNMNNPGLVPGTVTPQPLPTYDRAAQKAAVTTTITGAAASCSGSQTRIWAANTKITGDVTISNSCKVTVMGNVWITGSLGISNSAQMIVDNSLGIIKPNIMVDSSGGANFSNSSQLISNSSSTGFVIYTFWNTTGTSCTPIPADCPNVSGTYLASSRDVSTITLNNSASAPNTIFYAYWTQVQLSNSGQIGAVVGQTINLSNTATITFGTSAGIGSTTWVIKGYRKQ
jgi:hypothetical protein